MLDLSFNIGPIAVQLDITKAVEQPPGMFSSTLHEHVRDDTQIPVFNGDLVATGQAADPDTLLGGLLPAALIVKQDLLAGMTFQQAAADAQAKTGVTVTFFHDPTAVEYAVMLALIIVVCITGIARVQPGLRDESCMIRAKLEAGLAALGFQNPPDVCVATQ
jgi:Flp pilus assembly pilin Flp